MAVSYTHLDYTAELARDPQVRSVVSKTMEEWLLPAQLYIQNKFREAFDAIESELPEHTIVELSLIHI